MNKCLLTYYLSEPEFFFVCLTLNGFDFFVTVKVWFRVRVRVRFINHFISFHFYQPYFHGYEKVNTTLNAKRQTNR